MMRRFVSLLVLGLVAGCVSAEDTRSQPIRFTVTVPAAWDKVLTCLTAAYMDDLQPVALPDSRERRAELVLYFLGSSGQRFAQGIFDIRGTDAGTVVSFKRRTLIGGQESTEREARQHVDRCGRA